MGGVLVGFSEDGARGGVKGCLHARVYMYVSIYIMCTHAPIYLQRPVPPLQRHVGQPEEEPDVGHEGHDGHGGGQVLDGLLEPATMIFGWCVW